MVALANAFGHAIFCDDIRNEEGGKTTYVGVYRGRLIVHVPFPAQLPKFGIAVTYFERMGQCSGDTKLLVYMPGDDIPTITSDIPMAEPRTRQFAEDPNFPIDEPVLRADIPILLSPLVLTRIGVLRVRVTIGEDVVKIGALRVEQSLPPDTPALSGSEFRKLMDNPSLLPGSALVPRGS